MSIQVIENIEQLIETLTHDVADEDITALVPTMGNLHDGHMQLVEAAKTRANKVIVSVFVNPTQFGANEDFDSYPRTLDEDIKLCQAHDVDFLFTPKPQEMYPFGQDNMVSVNENTLAEGLCGAKRPGHFRGVLTVVMKLINLIQPDYAVFGEKDYQQLAVIHKMVQDLFMPVDLLAVPIVREDDGLAMSSRNRYLNVDERKKAPIVYDVLQEAKELLTTQSIKTVQEASTKALHDAGFKVDYFEICDPTTLKSLEKTQKEMVILVAAYLGNTRLIDNLVCE